jgi:hypothetical protein
MVEGNYIGTDITGFVALPNSNDGVLIDGAPNNLIGGTSAGSRNILSGNTGRGIEIAQGPATGNRIQGNYIGLAHDGDTVLGNGGDGVFITNAPGNTIGGGGGARNVISGNAAAGIQVLDVTSSGNSIVGNYIGTNFNATAARGNTTFGVFINGAPNNRIGGTSVADRNIISGNNSGVFVNGVNSTGNDVLGNFIGTNAFATGPLGNTFDGVRLGGLASNNEVGGPGAEHANVIAYNGGDGVVLDATGGAGNQIERSAIFANGGLGIDLFPDGVTANDAGDGDSGPNNLQNYPVLTDADSTSSGTTIVGTLNSAANTAYTLYFFSDVSCDPSGNGEGRSFLGSLALNTDGSGNATINVTLPSVVADQHVVSATATDASGNTSEFSLCRQVSGIPQPPLRQADVNCDGNVNSVDALLLLRFGVALGVVQNEPCPDIGTVLSQVFGDVDCTGAINSVDSLKVLRFASALPVTQDEPCVDINQEFP